MKTPPLFSIIIPTYNRAQYIPNAIKSVLNQTFTDWELIIVDDGSSDDTKAVVKPFLGGKVFYHYQENQKLSGVRNTGIRLAKGQYICFLDDDDYYFSNHLEILAKEINKKNQPVAIFRTGAYRKNRSKMDKIRNYSPTLGTPVQYIWKEPINLLAIAIHRSIFKKHIFPIEFFHFEDVHFLIRVTLDFPFYQLDDYTVVYVIHENMYSIKSFQRNKLAEKNELECMMDLQNKGGTKLERHISKKMFSEGKALLFLSRANKATLQRDFNSAVSLIFSAFKTKVSYSLLKSYFYSITLFFSKLLIDYPKLS